MAKEFDIDKYDDSLVSKRNRRIKQEADENRMIGFRPDVVIHEEPRKKRDKRRNLAIKKAIK